MPVTHVDVWEVQAVSDEPDEPDVELLASTPTRMSRPRSGWPLRNKRKPNWNSRRGCGV